MRITLLASVCIAIVALSLFTGVDSIEATAAAAFRGPPLTRHDGSVTGTIHVTNSRIWTRWCGATANSTRQIALREAMRFADKFSVRPLELLANSFDAPPAHMPNSRRLFQTIPSAVLTFDDGDKSKRQPWCIFAEIPMSEANSGVCSPFLKRALLSAHGSNESRALEFLKAMDGDQAWWNNQEVVVENSVGASKNVQFWNSREAAIAHSSALLRDELDLLVALAWKHPDLHIAFELTSNGISGKYNLSLALKGADANKPQPLRMTTRIERISEISHNLRFFITADAARFQTPVMGSSSSSTFVLSLLVRLPRHLARLDDSHMRRGDFARIWWQKQNKQREQEQDTIRIPQKIDKLDFKRAADVVAHGEDARSWDGIWVTIRFTLTAAEKQAAVQDASRSLRLFAAVEMRGILVPRLPVEAYPPDLNRLVALPAALVALRPAEGADDSLSMHVAHALNEEAASSSSSSSPSCGHFVRSENEVSLYQPGPDRAVPFVVLAFASLPVSALLIRIVAAVAKD